jgi:hypothetical protein
MIQPYFFVGATAIEPETVPIVNKSALNRVCHPENWPLTKPQSSGDRRH